MKIISDESRRRIWNKINNEYKFVPNSAVNQLPWLNLPVENKRYYINTGEYVWTAEREKLINNIFRNVVGQEMYALVWESDCFLYDPSEEIPFEYSFFDKERNVNVYFPSYYPNGDYHFFSSLDWALGLYGHPWKHEIYVVGKELIHEFEKIKDILFIVDIE